MPCLLTLIGIFFPRLVVVLIFLFSTWLHEAYAGMAVVWPILGFIFMPFTLLAYALAQHAGGPHGIYLILVIIAVLMDIGAVSGGASRRRT